MLYIFLASAGLLAAPLNVRTALGLLEPHALDAGLEADRECLLLARDLY